MLGLNLAACNSEKYPRGRKNRNVRAANTTYGKLPFPSTGFCGDRTDQEYRAQQELLPPGIENCPMDGLLMEGAGRDAI